MIRGQLVNYELPVKRKEAVKGRASCDILVGPCWFPFLADLQACFVLEDSVSPLLFLFHIKTLLSYLEIFF